MPNAAASDSLRITVRCAKCAIGTQPQPARIRSETFAVTCNAPREEARIDAGFMGAGRFSEGSDHCRSLGPVLHAQFRDDVVDVVLDGGDFQPECSGDLLVRQPLTDKLEDMALAR